jgi:diguanylate cyclase (GGDEF)-like protein/PAS domain S-box-containing protein
MMEVGALPPRNLSSTARCCGAFAIALGVTILAGWLADLSLLTRVHASLPAGMPNSALMFVACGVALIAQARRSARPTALLGAGFVVALSAATLVEHVADLDLGIDLRLGGDYGDLEHPGRPATHTAAAFLLLGGFLLLGRWRSATGNVAAGVLGAGAATIVGLAIAGYLTGVDYLYGSGEEHGMSVSTAIGLVVVLTGGLALRPQAPPASWYARSGAGEAAARRLMVPALVIPFLAGALAQGGASLGLYSDRFAMSLLIVLFAATIQGLIFLAVQVVRRHEAIREALESESRKNVERFTMLTREAPVGIFETDAEGRPVFVNQRWEEITGISAEEALKGRSAIHPEDSHWVRPAWEEAAARGAGWSAEFRYLRPTGEVRWVACHATAIRDEHGKVSSHLGSMLDITERRAAELRTGLVVGRIAEAVTIIGSDGTRLHANEAAQAILDEVGRARPEGPIGGQAWDLVDAERRPLSNDRLPAEVTRTSGAEIDDQVVGFPTETGDLRWLRISTRRLSDEGPPYTVVVSFVDITDQREADAQLAEAQRRFELGFDHAPIGVCLVSLDGMLMRVNRALCEMFGYSEEELIGSSFQELDESDTLDEDLERFARMLRGETGSYEMEKSYAHRDGSRVWASVSVSLVRGDDDKPLYFIAQILDVTERRRLERQLRHQAEHDMLTGLANRRAFNAELARQLARERRYGGECALLLVDLDGFKEVNDTLGHAVGDLVLEAVANVLRERTRDTDLAARLGGDEFAVLLPSTSRQGAEVLAIDLVQAIRELDVEPGAAVTASVGLVSSAELPGERDEESLLLAADDAMYAAKRGGRDGYRVSGR